MVIKKPKKSVFYLSSFMLFSIVLFINAQTVPDTITQKVTYSGQTVTLRMTKDSLRGPNFEVKVQDASGAFTAFTPQEVRTYIGTVDEYPDACVAGFYNRSNQLEAKIFFDRGKTWTTKAGSVTGTGGTATPTFVYPTLIEGYVSTKKSVFRYTNAIDVSNNYYAAQSSDINTILDKLEFSVCKIKGIYIRDLCIVPCLGRVVIRAAADLCPYKGLASIYDVISLIQPEWQKTQTDAKRFIVSEVDTRGGGAGIAYCPGFYSAWGAVSASSGDVEATSRHELGHNWSAKDYHAGSPEGPTTMCGNSISRFNGMTVGSILKYRDNNSSKLDSLGYYTKIKMPPYARLDTFVFLNNPNPVLIDVLANDHDCNGDPIILLSFDALSKNGASVSRSIGTGPSGRDQIEYKNPTISGLDYFFYKISDASGKTATGLVMSNVTTNIINKNNYIAIDNLTLTFKKNEYRIDLISNEKFQIDIYNLNGRSISSYSGNGPIHQNVPFSSKASGIYLVKVTTPKQVTHDKFLMRN